MEKHGFKEYTQSILEIGAKHGSNIDIDYLLPSAATINNNVNDIFELHLPNLIEDLKLVKYLAATTDLWSDNFRRLSYISITVHFIRNKTLCERILAVKQFNYDKQTGVNIIDKIRNFFKEYDKIN
jgi:hypothetical protein